jgi:hypothetical protein
MAQHMSECALLLLGPCSHFQCKALGGDELAGALPAAEAGQPSSQKLSLAPSVLRSWHSQGM